MCGSGRPAPSRQIRDGSERPVKLVDSMSLFVLREGYRVNATPAGARVVHESTGKTVDLAPEELQVFARATAGGIDARDPQVRAVIRKFVELGVLISARQNEQETRRLRAAAQRESRSAAGPTSGIRYQLRVKPSNPEEQVTAAPAATTIPKASPDDTVRLFRRDLKVSRHPPSSLFEVSDPVSGKSFQLYDFEVSMARMLDGRRRYSEIVEAGQRLGIPVNFQSLLQFVRQLEVYGFLAPQGAQAKESREASVWARSRQWDEALRALFQSGLRMHRHGRYAEAANYFEAMLEQDPQNPEALEMLEQTRQRMAAPSSPEAPQGAQESDPSQVGLEELLLEETSEPLEFTEEEPRLSNDSNTPDLDSWPSDEEDAYRPPSRIKKVLIVAAVAVAVVAVVAFVVHLRSVKSQTSTRVSESPKAKNGTPTKAGNLPPSPVDTGANLAQAPAPPPSSASTAEPEKKPEAIPDSAPQWIQVKVERHKRPKIADVRAPANGLVRWKAASRHAVRSGEVLGNVKEKRGGKERALVSPKDGVFVPKALQGAKARKMKKLASLLSTEVELEGYVAEKRPEKTWECQVLSEASSLKAPCNVEAVTSRGPGYWVTVKAQSLDDFDKVSNPVLRLTPEPPRSVSKASAPGTKTR